MEEFKYRSVKNRIENNKEEEIFSKSEIKKYESKIKNDNVNDRNRITFKSDIIKSNQKFEETTKNDESNYRNREKYMDKIMKSEDTFSEWYFKLKPRDIGSLDPIFINSVSHRFGYFNE